METEMCPDVCQCRKGPNLDTPKIWRMVETLVANEQLGQKAIMSFYTN